MKKLKFLALGLVAAFGFASCGDEEEVAFTSKEAKTTNTQIVMGALHFQQNRSLLSYVRLVTSS